VIRSISRYSLASGSAARGLGSYPILSISDWRADTERGNNQKHEILGAPGVVGLAIVVPARAVKRFMASAHYLYEY
jgi:hypothetical protein